MHVTSKASDIKDWLEHNQVAVYFTVIMAGSLSAIMLPDTAALERDINPALALMLYVTFLQVPTAQLGKAVTRVRFLFPLLLTNFLVIPLMVAGLVNVVPENPMLRLGVLLVLLTPCIDYVVTFSHLGRGNAHLLLASTPVLLFMQFLLLPMYLHLILGEGVSGLVQPGPFIHAFITLIMLPFGLATLTQFLSRHGPRGKKVFDALSLLPVPSTAAVLFIVVAAVLPQLSEASTIALQAVPAYVVYAVLAPLCGWIIAKIFRLDPAAGRAVAFSGATRNSLVVLPLALAVPDAIPVLPAVIVTQTMVELVSELIYIKFIPRLGRTERLS